VRSLVTAALPCYRLKAHVSRQSGKRQHESQGVVRQRPESVLAVEGRRSFVLRVDKKRVDADVLKHAPGSFDRIHQQVLPQSLSLRGAVHCKPAQADTRNFAWQFPDEILGQLFREDLACGQRVVTEYARRRIVRNGNEGLRDAAPLMLLRGLPKPGVKRRACALERVSVVATR